jgi:hypothetical protein
MAGLRTTMVMVALATIAAWGAWGWTIARTDPSATGWLGLAAFYTTLFLAVVGSSSLIGLGVRARSDDRERALRVTSRQSILVGLAVGAGLFLQSRGLLTWINLLFLVAALTLLELFWMSLVTPSSPSRS